jgi:hypothetical protein
LRENNKTGTRSTRGLKNKQCCKMIFEIEIRMSTANMTESNAIMTPGKSKNSVYVSVQNILDEEIKLFIQKLNQTNYRGKMIQTKSIKNI